VALLVFPAIVAFLIVVLIVVLLELSAGQATISALEKRVKKK
jgi:hypothetical protein